MSRLIIFFLLMLGGFSSSYSDESDTKVDELPLKDNRDLIIRSLNRALLEEKVRLSEVRRIYSPENNVMLISNSSDDSVQNEYIANFINKFEVCAYSLRPFDEVHQSGTVRFEVKIGLEGNVKELKIIEESNTPEINYFVDYSIRTCAPYAKIPEKIRWKAHTVLIKSKFEIVPTFLKVDS